MKKTKEGIFVFITILAIAGCIALFTSRHRARLDFNEIDRLKYVINLRETEFKKLQWQYEMLSQEFARFKDELTEVSRDTLTVDEINDFLKSRGIKTE